MKVELLIIDPQNDFSDHADAALGVPGALADATRLAALIARLSGTLDDIHVTLDTHQSFAIFHPVFWLDKKGDPPAPFTAITADDVEKGIFHSHNAQLTQIGKDYVQALAANGRYQLTIWPPHCLVGQWGHNVIPIIAQQLADWESRNIARIDFVTKGHNPYTEHYSAVQADVPDPSDPTTQLNTRLIETLERADLIPCAGWANSHCLKFTMEDIAANFGQESVKKLVLLTDATSPVPGFQEAAQEFMSGMKKMGAQLATCAQFAV